jgi:hypothetical protein
LVLRLQSPTSASEKGDLVAIADALADIAYGTALT